MTQVLPQAKPIGNETEAELMQRLLDKVTQLDPELARHDFYEEEYLIQLHGYWMVIRTINADTFDFMRLDRALRTRITERGWLYGIGIMSSAIAQGNLARICIPATPVSKPLWIWERHENEDAIALLKAYVTGLTKLEELSNADNRAA